jgi:hypothetical protein
MRIAFAVLLTLHGAVHLLGVVKGFNLAPVAGLAIPISRLEALVWLTAAVLLGAAAGALFLVPRWFWLAGAAGLVASQVAIVLSWADARFGTIPNVILLLAVVHAAFASGPFGLRAEYERRVAEAVARVASAAPLPLVGEADLAALPAPVQRYLRYTGVVGRPLPRGFRARLSGRIRGSATAPWMPFAAEQLNTYDPPRRYFWMEAARAGVPVDGLHVYDDASATMRVRLLSLVPVVDLGGPELMRTETVTVLNDISIFAPARLLDPAIRWRDLDARTVEATYTNGTHTVHAVLAFDDDGALADFWSDDRPALAGDGKTMVPQRWSTPVGDYRPFGGNRLATRGEGRYAPESGAYTYLEIEVHEVTTELVPRHAKNALPNPRSE